MAITPKILDGRRSTETLAGLARLATDAEVQVATGGVHRDDVIITPEKLNARQSTETIRGLAEIATTTETRSLTNDTHIVTPKKFHASQAEEGLTGVAQLVTSGGTARTIRTNDGTGVFSKTDHLQIVTPQVLDQYRATEFQPGALWVAIAGEVQVNDSTIDNAIITPKKLAAWKSTDVIRGIARRGTQAEVNSITGSGESWNNVFITPETLHTRFATETRRGVAEIATQVETDAGSIDTHIITPDKFSTYLSYDHFTTTTSEGLSHTGNIWDGVVLSIASATETQIGRAHV